MAEISATTESLSIIIIIILSSVSVRPQITTGAVVGIAVGGAIALIVGVLAGVVLFYCINKHHLKSKTSSHQQQAGPVYEEVHTTSGEGKIELKENVAYGPVKQHQKLIDLKAYEAYGHVQHWFQYSES